MKDKQKGFAANINQSVILPSAEQQNAQTAYLIINDHDINLNEKLYQLEELTKSNIDWNNQFNLEGTLLHVAAAKLPQALKLFLKAGANPNVVNHNGETVMHIAAKMKEGRGILNVLFDFNAKPTIRDKIFGFTPYQTAKATIITNAGPIGLYQWKHYIGRIEDKDNLFEQGKEFELKRDLDRVKRIIDKHTNIIKDFPNMAEDVLFKIALPTLKSKFDIYQAMIPIARNLSTSQKEQLLTDLVYINQYACKSQKELGIKGKYDILDVAKLVYKAAIELVQAKQPHCSIKR